MSQKQLNLGILAHVDAGKTTLTERLLYEAGAIRDVGSVDAGTTQTDSLALERQRGITIKAAVASFALDDVHVNLIDTPGHPDFIAEVERALGMLDGAVLVISAVEGVQPQTRILMRALQRLAMPTLLFVNKIDRVGADADRVVRAISERLAAAVVPMGEAHDLGSRGASFAPFGAAAESFRSRLAEVLAEHDDRVLASYVEDESGGSYPGLRDALLAQTKHALVYPVYFGSAITGAGVRPLMAGIEELLPAASGDPDGPLEATIFKIERGPSGEKVAYVRMFSGTIRARERIRLGSTEDKVTAIAVFDRGPAEQRASASAGEVAKLWGLHGARIGDRLPGSGPHDGLTRQFPPPTFESVVVPRDPKDSARLRVALGQLAEQDPLIDVRQNDALREMSVSLYGEVQKEVIEATLVSEYGIEVAFRDTTTICIERPVGTGEVLEVLQADTKSNVTGKSSPTSSNPFLATMALRVEPARRGSGIELRLDVDTRLVPLYIYKTVDSFAEHVRSYVRVTLEEGLHGWQVTDCAVTITDSGYRAAGTTAADFRHLTPLVLMRALERAGTEVCEPVVRCRLEIPMESIGPVSAALARLGGAATTQSTGGSVAVLETRLPAARVHDLQRRLGALTAGEGVLESTFDDYQPVTGTQPTRRRTTPNPLNLDEYLAHLAGRGAPGGD